MRACAAGLSLAHLLRLSSSELSKQAQRAQQALKSGGTAAADRTQSALRSRTSQAAAATSQLFRRGTEATKARVQQAGQAASEKVQEQRERLAARREGRRQWLGGAWQWTTTRVRRTRNNVVILALLGVFVFGMASAIPHAVSDYMLRREKQRRAARLEEPERPLPQRAAAVASTRGADSSSSFSEEGYERADGTSGGEGGIADQWPRWR